jgi:hypothetical protein
MDDRETLQLQIDDFNDRLDAKQAEALQLINKLVSGELTEMEFKESNKLITESLKELKQERAELIKKQDELNG